MEMEFETMVSVARIEAAYARYLDLSERMSQLVKDANKPNGQFIETLEMNLANYPAVDARIALQAVYDDIRITADLPQRHVLDILNRRFQVIDIHDWCDKLLAKGGAKLSAGWLREEVTDGIVFKDRPLDPVILKSAVLMDAGRKVSRIKPSLLAA